MRWLVRQQTTADRALTDGNPAWDLALVRFCLESACPDRAMRGWSRAAWQRRVRRAFAWLLGGPGPPGSRRDALFLASSRTRGPFPFIVPYQSRFGFTSPEMVLIWSLISSGVPRKGLVVVLYRLIIPMACQTTIRAPLISLLRAGSPSVGPPACLSELGGRLAGCRMAAPGRYPDMPGIPCLRTGPDGPVPAYRIWTRSGPACRGPAGPP